MEENRNDQYGYEVEKLVSELDNAVDEFIRPVTGFFVLESEENRAAMATSAGLIIYLHSINAMKKGRGLLAPNDPELTEALTACIQILEQTLATAARAERERHEP